MLNQPTSSPMMTSMLGFGCASADPTTSASAMASAAPINGTLLRHVECIISLLSVHRPGAMGRHPPARRGIEVLLQPMTSIGNYTLVQGAPAHQAKMTVS